jgi:DNA (cytosine-5)-methyltransferase 1
MGYHRAGFEVVGVDHRPQPNYPFEFHQDDAFHFLENHYEEFDVLHASPPCQAYSEATPMAARANHPDLIGSVRQAFRAICKPYVIENVDGARYKLEDPFYLCGTMFGLNLYRHRWFEVRPFINSLVSPCYHQGNPVVVSGSRHGKGESKIPEMIAGLEVPWMKIRHEVRQAIPPAYTEWIGKQLIKTIGGSHATDLLGRANVPASQSVRRKNTSRIV